MSKKYIGLLSGICLFLLILILPNPGGMSTEAKNALAVVSLMTVWWIFESIPVYATAFIPLVLYPMMRVLPAGETAENYGHSYVLMMLAGFLLAKSIESSNLHKRIAPHQCIKSVLGHHDLWRPKHTRGCQQPTGLRIKPRH